MIYLLYALLAALSDVLSGLLFLNKRIAGIISTRYTLAFASGAVISLAFFELIPEAELGASWSLGPLLLNNTAYLALGFFAFYLVEKIVLLHACAEKGMEECEIHTMGWVSVVGMASDNLIDGVGIGVGFTIDPALGLLIAVAVVVHEVPQGITTASIMRAGGFKMARIMTVLSIAGLMYIIGALISGLIPPTLYTAIIALVAGSFLYIGAGDLLSEVHRKFNSRVVFMVMVGAILMFLLELLL